MELVLVTRWRRPLHMRRTCRGKLCVSWVPIDIVSTACDGITPMSAARYGIPRISISGPQVVHARIVDKASVISSIVTGYPVEMLRVLLGRVGIVTVLIELLRRRGRRDGILVIIYRVAVLIMRHCVKANISESC